MRLPSLDLTREHLVAADASSDRTRDRRVRDFKDRRKPWSSTVREAPAETLREEWSPNSVRAFRAMRALAGQVRGRRVLLWGAQVGTFVYPFDEAACDVVIVEPAADFLDVARRRLDIDRIPYGHASAGDGLTGEFAAIVALGLAQEADPFGLLAEFHKHLLPGGLLVTSLSGFSDLAPRTRCQRFLEETMIRRDGPFLTWAA